MAPQARASLTRCEWYALPAVFLLLLALLAQVLLAMRTKSPTCDEYSHHVASGYSYWVTGDFRMNPASPPLPRLLVSLPLLFLKAKAPLDHASWESGDAPKFSEQFFMKANPGRLNEFIFWSRVPIALLSVIFGVCLFFWLRSLLGVPGALAGLALYAFSPEILAHSGLATADLAVAFFFFLSLAAFERYLRLGGRRRLWPCAVFAGLALLSKFSAVLLFPILAIVGILSGVSGWFTLRKAVLFFGICFLTVWAGYHFEMKPLLEHTPAPEKKMEVYRKAGGEGLGRFAEKVPVPLSTFVSAIASMAHTRAQGTNAYLMGEWSRKGWWYYYFIAFGIKNTLPFLFLFLGGVSICRFFSWDRTALATVLAPIVFFFFLTMGDKAQAGIRYFLPIYPFAIALAAGTCVRLWKMAQATRVAVVLLLGWHAAEALLVFPHYLAYFNQIAGGPPGGYRWLRDSNVDWGQDLKGVAEYLRSQGHTEAVISTLCPVNPAHYGITARPMSEEEFQSPKKAVYAIGAHYLDGPSWTKERKPDKVIGHSFFIYDFSR